MGKLYEEQVKAVEKAIRALRKEVPVPNSYLPIFRKFFHYLYSIGFYKGYYIERTHYGKPVIMRKNGKTYNWFKNIKDACEKTGYSRKQIDGNIHGTINGVDGYQFRYTRMKEEDLQEIKSPSF